MMINPVFATVLVTRNASHCPRPSIHLVSTSKSQRIGSKINATSKSTSIDQQGTHAALS
jgi:hypothetical protein